MFHDLNELQEELHQHQPFDIYSSPYGPPSMTNDPIANGGMDMSIQLQSNQINSNVKRYLHSREQPSFFNALPLWPPEFFRSDERNYTPRSLGHCDVASEPWPRGQTIPRGMSPDGYWIDSRSTIEQESCSGSSAWSDRTSEGRPEYEAGPGYGFASWNSQRGSIASQFDAGCSPTTPKDGVFTGSSSDSCIALRDVQEYPDAGSEDAYKKPEIQELEPAASYFMEAPAPYQPRTESVHFIQDDEGIGSSIHDDSVASPTKEEAEDDDANIEDEVRDDGGDSDVSDYSPAAITKRTTTRRTSRAKAPVSPTTKRPSRSKASPTTTLTKSSKITKHLSKSSSPTSPTLPSNSTSKTKSACPHCSHVLPSASARAKHISTTHTRPFTCPFTRYGCPSTFGSKNEWKRHVSSQHLRLGIYRCDIGSCVPRLDQHRRKSSSASTTKRGDVGESSMGHNDFNRKDLFTQHIRRMHSPPNPADADAFDATLESIRQRCWKSLRSPPPRSSCGYCPSAPLSSDASEQQPGKEVTFSGPASWDERMEHVARHLEQGTTADKEREDVRLQEWMVGEGLLERVGGGWRVVGVAGRRRRGASGGKGEGEEDAVGEEE